MACLISSIPREGSETGRPCSPCVGAIGLTDLDVSRPIAVAKKADSEFLESAFAAVGRSCGKQARLGPLLLSRYFKVTISNMGRASSQVRLLLA